MSAEESSGPVHLLMKWAPGGGVDTIERHKSIAERLGSVWWGKLAKDPSKPGIAPARLDKLSSQVDQGVSTSVFLVGAGTAWRARLLGVSTDPADVDEGRRPDYYDLSSCNLFVELSNFEEIGLEWVHENLTLQSNPGTPMAKSLSGQTSLMYVLEMPLGVQPSPATSGSVAVFSATGQPFDQQISVATRGGYTVVTLESAGGGRNQDYDAAFEAILRRAATDGWSLVEVVLVSREVDGLSRDDRRIAPDGPILLDDPRSTRRAIQRAVAKAHRQPGAAGGGNPQKRIELVFSHGDDDAELELAIAPAPDLTATPPTYEVDAFITVRDGHPRLPSGKELERAWQLHNQTQMRLVDWIKEQPGAQMIAVQGANVDVAWTFDGASGITIAEVKSLTLASEDRQLRMAIGEVLHFAEIAHRQHHEVGKVIFVPHQPAKEEFEAVCHRVGIELRWPGNWPAGGT